MTSTSIANREADRGSTRDVKATAEYCQQLASDFGMRARTVLDCLKGEPAKQAYKLARWAFHSGPDSPERERALLNYAKKHRLGIYRPAEDVEFPVPTRVKPRVKRGSAPPMAVRQAMASAFLGRRGA